ncbi:MAG: twin-arginine translocase TatA/TatE family subunit [Desulfuromonas sp.]|nr:MAG: twin-arginine translocase TatA/TatE family subunit [Desulfuromonas sp.]
MFGLGMTELLILLVLVLVFFGAGKLPSVATALGRSVGSFREGIRDAEAIDVTPGNDERKD